MKRPKTRPGDDAQDVRIYWDLCTGNTEQAVWMRLHNTTVDREGTVYMGEETENTCTPKRGHDRNVPCVC